MAHMRCNGFVSLTLAFLGRICASSDAELAAMRADVDLCKQLGVDGVVFGMLLPSGAIDADRTREFLLRAHPLLVTFHRAFDMTPDLAKSAKTLMQIGVTRVLTSGGSVDAIQGLDTIKVS
jgi:copper homeostasis protein